jgi:hypothetical protein
MQETEISHKKRRSSPRNGDQLKKSRSKPRNGGHMQENYLTFNKTGIFLTQKMRQGELSEM